MFPGDRDSAGIEAGDRARQRIIAMLDMAKPQISLLIRFLRHNNSRSAAGRRRGGFAFLRDDDIIVRSVANACRPTARE